MEDFVSKKKVSFPSCSVKNLTAFPPPCIMNFKLFTGSFSLLIFLTLFASAAPIIEIQKIAGKTEEEVEKVLGKPTQTEKTKQGPKRIYESGQIEIVFIGGKADWITVSEMSSVPFDGSAIKSLGLKFEPPTSMNAQVIRWEPYANFHSVSVFALNGKVDYAYVKVATK